jgi:putative SOS response-associated peptidase YedK
MCYSAQIEASYKAFVRRYGAIMDIHEYVRIANRDLKKAREAFRVPRAVALSFVDGDSPAEKEIAAAFLRGLADQVRDEQAEIAALRERLQAAQARLEGPRPTKKAADDVHIATRKIAAAERRLANLQRADLQPADSRLWPGQHVPVMIVQDGRRLVTPMRYRCRPYYVGESFDKERPGTYNARLDSLETFWKPLFGHRHAVLLVTSFYEMVDRGGKATEIEFLPDDGEPMLVACLWSDWGDGDDRLQSFAIITDEPPPEVRAAGHDRMIVRIRPEDLDAWLNPDPSNLQALYDLFDRRPRPHYSHRLPEPA